MVYFYVLTAFLAIILLWYQRRRYNMSLFQRLNIPGPHPHLITGNLKEVKEKGIIECQKQWTEKYGKILGYYIGGNPILLVSDPELVKYVEVKNFQDFFHRPVFPSNLGFPDDRAFGAISLISSEGQWKRIRSLLSPGFTTSKMKQMTELVMKASVILSEKIKEKMIKQETLKLDILFHNLMMDVIERTVFGRETDTQHQTTSLYQESVKMITHNDLFNIFIFVNLCLPEFEPIVFRLEKLHDMVKSHLGLPSCRCIFDYLGEVIKMRRTGKVTRPDLLQAMIDANLSEKQIQSITENQLTASMENDGQDIIATQTRSSSKKAIYMTDDEVVANAVQLMMAGHHTTSTTLHFVLRLLAKYPDVQEKIREEVNSVLEGEEPDYTAITKMNYLQQVISETLRLYPTVLMFIFRTAGKSFTYKNFNIPEGIAIQPALWPMHRDPELWTDAEKFDPDRFSPSRKSEINNCAYQPFGLGPRNCVGLKFAYTVMKLVLAHLLHSFKFVEEGQSTEKEVKLVHELVFIKPAGDIGIKAMAV